MNPLLLAAIPSLFASGGTVSPAPAQPVAGTHPLTHLILTDQSGDTRSVARAAMGSKAAIVVLYGGVPEAEDASVQALRDLQNALGGRDLRVLALVAAGTSGRDAAESALAEWHTASDFPGDAFVLGAAPDIAHRMLPGFHGVKELPCLGLLDNDGHIQGLYGPSALSDPGLRDKAAKLLAAEPKDHSELQAWLSETRVSPRRDWFDFGASTGGSYDFKDGDDGSLEVTYQRYGSGVPVIYEWTAPVEIYGEALFIRDEILRVDLEAKVLHDVRIPSRRACAFGAPAPLLGDTYEYAPEDWEMALRVRSEVYQREAIWALSYHRRYASNSRLTEVVSAAERGSPQVREVSLWGIGMVHEKDGIPAIIANLEHGLPGVRLAAVNALARFFSRDPSLKEHLSKVADDTDPRVRAAYLAAVRQKR